MSIGGFAQQGGGYIRILTVATTLRDTSSLFRILYAGTLRPTVFTAIAVTPVTEYGLAAFRL
jgi:hypothetical protein